MITYRCDVLDGAAIVTAKSRGRERTIAAVRTPARDVLADHLRLHPEDQRLIDSFDQAWGLFARRVLRHAESVSRWQITSREITNWIRETYAPLVAVAHDTIHRS